MLFVRSDRRDHSRGCFQKSGSRRPERHGDAIHAVAKPCRLGAVVKHMTKMAAAAFAMDCSPQHSKGRVVGRTDSVFQWRPEAWPTCFAVEFRGRGEQIESAARTDENAETLFMQQWACERPLGAALP